MAFFVAENWTAKNSELFPDLGVLIEETRELTPSTFLNYFEAFEKLFKSAFVPSFLAHEVAQVARVGNYDQVQSDSEIEIFRSEYFRISVAKIKAASAQGSRHAEVVCHGNDHIRANLGPPPLEFDIFEMPAEHRYDVFDRSVRPNFVRRYCQPKGEALGVEAGRHILRMVKPPADAYQVFAVSLQSRYSVIWHFDADNLEPKYAAAANLMSSRVQTAIGILGQMAGQSALPVLTAAAESGDHFVRWSAISAVTAIVQQEGLVLLRRALEDPHPHVRSAANRALLKLYPSHLTAG
ncbi:HEAT repeat domain-containing protein [Bradyrhizobium sp. SSUT18]|uniref:HEAT repeat domain-containing protein n=1 Tax=unclassified Bradyrhizobium TaxID=2631580 RepID=UPI002449F5E5|nr:MULTISPECIES: HEAT repeat domain-containing protein [unclassified Bradyrhizobium]MDH2350186.1 HEAT repeat domain-containing protein [Bradyrhizobium sp. SSUT112]MDH2399726.1 HEAT repeat domain-containing protein [Bradyrhizobium sp. SSUT18]